MGKLQYKDLPFFYAATGSDKTSSLYGLEKRIALGADKWIDYHDVPDKLANIIICSVDTFLEKNQQILRSYDFFRSLGTY